MVLFHKILVGKSSNGIYSTTCNIDQSESSKDLTKSVTAYEINVFIHLFFILKKEIEKFILH